MTVVLESEGTITVVVFAGAGGLLLLMQPDSTGIRINKLARPPFITASSSKNAKPWEYSTPSLTRGAALGSGWKAHSLARSCVNVQGKPPRGSP
jgi:hypothetical protein